MSLYHDPSLGAKLGATNPDSDIVLNATFKDWTEYLIPHLSHRIGAHDSCYKSEQRFLKKCEEHARTYRRPIPAENTVMLVHPFYLHLSHMDRLPKGEQRRSYVDAIDKYTDTLLDFLQRVRFKLHVNVVALETIHHYAAATSLLLERGIIDVVVFTRYDDGIPLERGSLDPF